LTKTQKWAAALLVIILIAGVYTYHLGYWTIPTEPQTELPPPKPGEKWTGGTYDLITKGRNSLDSSASLTSGTDFDSSWYRFSGGSWVFIGSGSGSSGNNLESIAEDEGYLWHLVEEKSSKYFYADVPMTLSKNPYIIDYKWVDVDGDTDKEFVFKCSLWSIPPPASGYPSRTFYPYFLAESSQGTDANALQWETQPSDITGVGTSTVTKYIGWETKLTAEKRAVGIHKVELVVNSTTTTLWELDQVNIPGVGYIDGSLFTEDVRSSDTKYQYIIGTDFDNIVYWKVPAGTNNKFDNTVAVKCTFTSGTALQFTLYVYQWLYDRTSVSDNDAVVLTQA
jgi:hypothetical protein